MEEVLSILRGMECEGTELNNIAKSVQLLSLLRSNKIIKEEYGVLIDDVAADLEDTLIVLHQLLTLFSKADEDE